ncbi:MAG TPA: trehalose-phosphatase [Rhizobacter sp.]|nr:trehalose-phosphatase [Rhizobacter sp.]
MTPLFSPAGDQALVDLLQRRPLLAFDFDGTLAPIVDRPERARVPMAWAEMLIELARLLPTAIVTGRSVTDVTARLPFSPRYVLGNHGAEDPKGAMRPGSVARLAPVRHALDQLAPQWQALGIELEDKQFSLALHYRRAPDLLAAREWIDALLRNGDQAGLHIFHGKCVLNIAPDDAADKADAVMSLVRRAGTTAALFAGDDINDEPVFERVPHDWLTLKVGDDGHPSRARYVIDTQEDVGKLLKRLLELAVLGAAQSS